MGGGKRSRKKLARQQNNFGGKRVPHLSPVASDKSAPSEATQSAWREMPVRWTVAELDIPPGESLCLWSLEAKETKELLTFLESISRKTWKECLAETVMSGRKKQPRNHDQHVSTLSINFSSSISASSARNHDQHVSTLSINAQKRIQALPSAEERVFRFRLSGETRLWGFRSGDLFRVLWYDPHHAVCPVEKRNT